MAETNAVTKPAGRALLLAVENAQLRSDIPELKAGDTVRLQVKVVEGNRERLQPFEGVIMRLRGSGVNRNFTVRRITNGVGVERTFLVNSPRIEKIDVLRHARVRRAQLYYLRGLTGKAARLKELRPTSSKSAK
jgi:large subunit ribosomal protein L19